MTQLFMLGLMIDGGQPSLTRGISLAEILFAVGWTSYWVATLTGIGLTRV